MRTGLFSEQTESGKYTDFEARFLLTIWSSKMETTRVDVRAWQSPRLGMQANVGGILKSTGGFKAISKCLRLSEVQASLFTVKLQLLNAFIICAEIEPLTPLWDSDSPSQPLSYVWIQFLDEALSLLLLTKPTLHQGSEDEDLAANSGQWIL